MNDIYQELRSRLDRSEERERERDNLLSRIDERVKAGIDEADHRHKNLQQAISGLATLTDHVALERRVADVESTQRWMVRSAVAGYSAVAGGLFALGRKLGVWS